MATIEVQKSEVRCDRCDKRIVKPRQRVLLTNHGVNTTAQPTECDTEIDLCGGCETSLGKWWLRKAADK